MSEEGSGRDDTVEDEPRDPRLIETGELPRQDPAVGDEPRPIDPWSEVTPPVIRGEGGAHRAREEGPTAELEPSSNEDGPFAIPLDAPAKGFTPAPKGGSKEPLVARKDERAPSLGAVVRSPSRLGPVPNLFSSPIPMSRRIGRAPSVATAGEPSVSPTQRKPSSARPPAPERRYPRMRALLKNPDDVPHGTEPIGGRPGRPPPVPGTFFPAPRQEKDALVVPAAPRDLDEMLACMAEGLLVGEGTSGQTEVRVTLRDEFFAGTELRISAGLGMVSAVLMPPDRGTYLMLNAHLDELKERLEARGLQILELRVAEP